MCYQAIESFKIFTVSLQGIPIELNGALLVLKALMGHSKQETSLAKQEVVTVLPVMLTNR